MIGAWLDRKLQGAPDQAMTIALVVLGMTLLVLAFKAPSWLKAGALVWVLAP